MPHNSKDPEVPGSSLPPSTNTGGRSRRILALLGSFTLGQGALQGVNILIGLYLMRALTVEHYAQFGLTQGFQATASTLMDLGYASTIIPLVGERFRDRALVGSYLRGARHLRDRSFWMLGPLAAVTFIAIMHKHHWGLTTETVLVASVLLSLYSTGAVAYYATPLFLYHRLRDYYQPQTLSAIGRFASYLGLEFIGALDGCTAAALNSVNTLVNATVLRGQARRYVEWPQSNDPKVNREILLYILPAIPTFIFAAFQSQIALFLVNAFGRTVNVAEVAALNRLALIFTVFMTFNAIIVEPRIARFSREKLLPAYLLLILASCSAGALVVAIAFVFPEPIVWLIGPRYRNLSPDIGWVVLTGCFSYIANLIWIMNRARRWIFWRGTMLEIIAMFTVDVCFIAFAGVRDTRHAVLFTLASSISAVCTHSYIGYYGFRHGERDLSAAVPRFLRFITPKS
jgi:O-antigen/teichoic acid export membrane protein